MKRIRLVVTGRAEEKALHSALQAYFGSLVDFLPPIYVESFTSARLGPLTSTIRPKVNLRAGRLAAMMAAEIDVGQSRELKPDLVVAIDDLELANADQPEVALAELHMALIEHVEKHWKHKADQHRILEELSQRASFHFLTPMLETYFFSDPRALERAGVVRPNLFDAEACDVERFLVRDPSYDTSTYSEVVGYAQHPKHYIQYLSEEVYRETHEGANALKTLDFELVLKNQTQAQFLRSLIDDIGEALDLPRIQSGTHPLTTRRSDLLLRNVE